jgi:hypothetical protein
MSQLLSAESEILRRPEIDPSKARALTRKLWGVLHAPAEARTLF